MIHKCWNGYFCDIILTTKCVKYGMEEIKMTTYLFYLIFYSKNIMIIWKDFGIYEINDLLYNDLCWLLNYVLVEIIFDFI